MPLALLVAISLLALVHMHTVLNKEAVIRESLSKSVVVEYRLGHEKSSVVVIHGSMVKKLSLFIANLYVGLPNAEIRYLGLALGDRNGRARLSSATLEALLDARSEWLRTTDMKTLDKIRVPLLVIVDVLVRANLTSYKIYTFITTVPLSLELIEKGYEPLIRITLGPDNVIQTGIVNFEKLIQLKSPSPCNDSVGQLLFKQLCNPLYCVHGEVPRIRFYLEWSKEGPGEGFRERLIPIIMLRINNSRIAAEIPLQDTMFSMKSKGLGLRLFASAAMPGKKTVYLPWIIYGGVRIEYAKAFVNKRHSLGRYEFLDDSIVAIGVMGSGSVFSLSRRMVIERGCPGGAARRYVYSDEASIKLAIYDIALHQDRDGELAARYSYMVDDVLGDNKGLERLWNSVAEHLEPYMCKTGRGEVHYVYSGDPGDDIDLAIPLSSLVEYYNGATQTQPNWLSTGVSWGRGAQGVVMALAFLNNNSAIGYCIYRLRENTYLYDRLIHPIMMYIDVTKPHS